LGIGEGRGEGLGGAPSFTPPEGLGGAPSFTPPEGDGGKSLPSTSLKNFDGGLGGRPLASLSALVCHGIGRETTSPMQSAKMNRKNLKFMIV